MFLQRSLCAAVLAGSLLFAAQADDTKVLAATQIVAHPALDAAYQGVIDELAEAGFKEGGNLRVMREIAQGDQTIATQIAKKFAGEKPDVILAISTPSASEVERRAIGTTSSRISVRHISEAMRLRRPRHSLSRR